MDEEGEGAGGRAGGRLRGMVGAFSNLNSRGVSVYLSVSSVVCLYASLLVFLADRNEK